MRSYIEYHGIAASISISTNIINKNDFGTLDPWNRKANSKKYHEQRTFSAYVQILDNFY